MAVLLFLVSCGSSTEETKQRIPASEPDPVPKPRQVDGRPKIVAFGDSITAGHGVEPGQSYVDYLQKALDAMGRRYLLVNEGVSGDTTSNGLERLPTILAMNPAVVLLELGGNDGLRGIPIDTTRANLEEMIQRLQQAGAKVVLAGMTLPANYGPDHIRRFEQMYSDLAAKYKVQLVPFRLEKLSGGAEILMQRDGLHLTREGNRQLGAYLAKELTGILP
jgi:acyl-CoA thioesterase-1